MNTTLIENNSETFSISRLILLIRTHLLSSYRSWLATSAALAGIILLTRFISDSDSYGFYDSWFGNVLILGGIYFSSKTFQELHDKTRNESYLLIPASTFEKTLARLLVTTVGFIAYVLIFMLLVSILSELIKPFFFGASLPIFNPLSEQVWILIGAFLFIQSFYFLGAAWFRKSHAVKTTITLIGILIGLAIFGMIVVRVLFASYMNVDLDFNFNPAELFVQSAQPAILITKIGIVVLTLTCWTIAWMRVKETQVSDGV